MTSVLQLSPYQIGTGRDLITKLAAGTGRRLLAGRQVGIPDTTFAWWGHVALRDSRPAMTRGMPIWRSAGAERQQNDADGAAIEKSPHALDSFTASGSVKFRVSKSN